MKKSMLCLLAAAGAAMPAFAQPSMYLVQIANYDSLATTTNTFFVGGFPRGGVMINETKEIPDGSGNFVQIESMFVNGFNAGSVAINTNIVKVEDVFQRFGPRAFRIVPGSALSLPGNRGYTGMDFRAPIAGATDVTGGLVTAWDLGGTGPTQQKLWDVTTQLNPILLTTSNPANSFRGTAGPAWDAGFNAQGFTIGANSGRPVVAILDFSSSGQGPFGVDPNDLDTEIYTAGAGPILNTADPFGFTIGGTIWRDIDVHPDTGLVAARAFNDVVIATRNANNSASIVKVIDGPAAPGNNPNPGFQVGQEVAIMHGFVGGDILAWNNRPTGNLGQPMSGALQFADLSGNPVAMQLLDPVTDAPTTLLPIDGTALYGLYWDRGMLVVLDGSSGVPKQAYVFKQCLADVNNDGLVDLSDFFDFLNGFDASNNIGDVNFDGSIDLVDFFLFLNKFDVSC